MLTGFLKTVTMKYAFCLIFEFTTSEGLKSIPSDRKEKERSVKRVEKRKITVLSIVISSTFSGEEKNPWRGRDFLQHCFHKSRPDIQSLVRAKIKKKRNSNYSKKLIPWLFPTSSIELLIIFMPLPVNFRLFFVWPARQLAFVNSNFPPLFSTLEREAFLGYGSPWLSPSWVLLTLAHWPCRCLLRFGYT